MAKNISPFELLIAGIVFLGVGIGGYGKIPYDYIIILFGFLFLVVGLLSRFTR